MFNHIFFLSGAVGNLYTASTVFNFLAAAILTVALFPPYLDTKRSRKTYGLGEGFFNSYLMGCVIMLANALLNILINTNNVPLLLMFIVFVFVNGLSLYLNSYILKVKKQNMREAKEKNMSEQDYWEKYIKPSLESVNTPETGALTDPNQI